MNKYGIYSLCYLIVIILISGCNGGSGGGSDVTTRSYYLGFTDFPYDATLTAVADTWDVLNMDADMVTMHFDDGIPWQEALDGENTHTSYTANYNQTFLDSLNYKQSQIPVGHIVYLAVTPLNFNRDGLAAHRGAAANEPLTSPWDGYALDSPDVVTAYNEHCENMISLFHPDYFAYAIEANILYTQDSVQWPAFVNLAQATYTAIKANHPDLPVFVSLQASFFHGDESGQTTAIQQILPYTDYIAVSAYPYTSYADPVDIPADFYTSVAALAPDKPFAIAETAWPAEDVTSPYPVTISETPQRQQAYLQRLLADADSLHAEFINWFFTRDYDDFWNNYLSTDSNAALIRLWKDTGLYDGAGTARPALADWQAALATSH
jgi:hypothetical protein